MAEEPLLQTWTSVATRKVMMCKGMYNAASSVYDVMINALMATVVAKLKLFRSICHQMGQEPFHLCNLFSQKSICHKCCNTQQVPPVVDATLECLDRVEPHDPFESIPAKGLDGAPSIVARVVG